MAKTTKTPAPATEAPAKPTTYALTEKGAALKTRDGTARSAAWSVLARHAGKPDGLAAYREEMGKTPNLGSITATNLMGWARKQGLVA